MYEIMVESQFSSAHQLMNYDGKCENIHGHNWKVQVVFQGEQLQSNGILVDFCDLKPFLDDILQDLDHCTLNELEPFRETNPTAENIACYIFRQLTDKIKTAGARLYKVSVWESDKCMSAYFEDR